MTGKLPLLLFALLLSRSLAPVLLCADLRQAFTGTCQDNFVDSVEAAGCPVSICPCRFVRSHAIYAPTFDRHQQQGQRSDMRGACRDEDHLALFIELLGKMPKKISGNGSFSKDFFNRHGELRHIKSLRFWPLDKVLTEKYNMPEAEVSPGIQLRFPHSLLLTQQNGVILL